jgi:hypothetical protein
MAKTIISPLVHSPEEHAIVAIPDNESVGEIVRIQGLLKALLGDAIWLTPPNALHSTLMEIICDTEYKGLSRKEHFTHWHDLYNDATRETISQFPPIDLTLSELSCSPAAIILKAANPSPFNNIREALLRNIVLPEQTKIPPDIIHCTIARYSKEVDLNEVREQVKGIGANVGLHISEFKLVRDLGPDFHPSVEQSYSLSA